MDNLLNTTLLLLSPNVPDIIRDQLQDEEETEHVAKMIVFLGLNFHYYLFLIGYIARYAKYRNLG
jgi:hypothetical protein